MKFVSTTESRVQLAAKAGYVIGAAHELTYANLTEQEKFEILWKLAFVYLSDLENWRQP